MLNIAPVLAILAKIATFLKVMHRSQPGDMAILRGDMAMMKRLVTGLVGTLLVVLTATTTFAQGTAQISGIVRDSGGGVLPGADVTATQTDTGVTRSTVSETSGAYVLANLPIGPYRLEVKLQGFRTFQQTGIVLQVNTNPVVDVVMQLGEVAETITVTGNTTMVETRNTGVGQTMDNRRIMELPLNGRNPADLITVLPAVVPQTNLNATSRSMQGGLAFSVAGSLSFGVSYTLDGANHNNPYDNLNLPLPFPDALQEFRAETSALTAQNGMHSGAAVTAVTKSGTNQFRGNAFEFFRHHNFNATDPFAAKNPDGSLKDDGLKRNQYGVTFGGPVVTDRAFFFGAYQATHIRQIPSDNRAFVPTAQMLAGDFTTYASAACTGGVARNLTAPFVNNRIDPAQFSRAALNITSRLPTATDPCGLVQYGLPLKNDDHQFVGKLDYQLNQKHSFFGRYIAYQVVQPPPFELESAEQNILVTRMGGRDNLAQTAAVGWNNVISPTTLNAVRFAFNRTSIHRTSTDFFSAPEVGINIYSYRPHYMLLTVGTAVGASPNGFQLGGGTESESTFDTNMFQISDDATFVRGNHQFGFGANVSNWSSLSLANVRSPGQFTIDGSQTGLPLSDFLVGRMGVSGLTQAAPNTLDMTQTYLGVYAQDTWRLNTRMTLNYGLRWEPFFPQQLVNGAVYQFDLGRFQQNIKSTVFPNGPAGLYFPDDPDFPSKAGMLTQWDNLAPRIGLAWDPAGDGRTSVRVAYSKAFEFVNAQFHLNTSVAPPWGSEVRLNSPPGGLDDPFLGNPGGQTNIFPVTFDQNASFSLNGPFLSLSNDMQSTNVHQWNATVERQIGSDWLVTAGYVGSRINNIWESVPLNNALFIPVGGVAPSTANTNARRPLTLADPTNGRYYAGLDLYVTDGTQRYHGMILSTSRRSLRGIGMTANYTLSHCFGSPEGGGGGTTNIGTGYNKPEDPGFDDGNCAADRLHNFSATASYQTPDFQNATWRAIGSGWRLVGAYRAITGPWVNITTGTDRALNGQQGTQRPNQILDDPFADQAILPNGARRYLNPLAFQQPAVGTFGTLERNSVRGLGNHNLDLALSRSFRLTGTQAFEVRMEAFNAFNWMQWGLPNANLFSPTFGQISSVIQNSPRIMQFAVKYQF